jgi:DNA-binding transcriptional ArsR family regulator
MRRGAIELLRRKPRRAGELAVALSVSAARMSQHLRVLRESGLIEGVDSPRDARARVYRLRAEPLTELSGWLAETEAFWGAELAAFKAHAERTRRRKP